MVVEKVKNPITIYANRQSASLDRNSINSIRCKNVTIRRINRKKDYNEKIMDETDRNILWEAGYIMVSNRNRSAEEGVSFSSELIGALRAQKPSLEVFKLSVFL